MEGLHLPFASRNDAVFLAGNFDARRFTKAKLMRRLLDLVDAKPPRSFIKENVTGMDDAVAQIHVAMTAFFPAMENVIAENKLAAAIDAIARRSNARFNGSQS